MDATAFAARHLLAYNKLGGYGSHNLGDKLHAPDAGVLAAIVIFVGIGLPLACYFRKGCACWEARREAAERAAKADHARWTEAGGTTAAWVEHRQKSLGADVAPAGVEMRQTVAKKAVQAPPQRAVDGDAPGAPAPAAAPKRWGRGAKAAAPLMDVEAPEEGGAAGGAGPPPAAGDQRRGGGLLGRFAKKPAQQAGGRIEETPLHGEGAPSTVYTGDESSLADDDFTESDYTESRASGRR